VLHERVLAAAHFRGRHGESFADSLWGQLQLGPADVQLRRAPDRPAGGAAPRDRQEQAAGAPAASDAVAAAAPTRPEGGATP
jgi:hypothetical protein